MGRRLEQADHCPLDGGVGLPPPDPIEIHVSSAGRDVCSQKSVQVTESAHPTRATEPPRPGTQPPDVLRRVPQVGQFPVEYGTQPGAVDQEVAHPEVTVDHHRSVPGWMAAGEPPCPQFQNGPNLVEGVEEIEWAAQRILAGQSGDGCRINGMDGRQGPGRLVVQTGKDAGKLFVPQDPPGDGLAFQPFDH